MGLLTKDFGADPYPGKPKILFVALGSSTHTQSWIDLLEDAQFNVRLFSMPGFLPPQDWPVRTYITCPAGTKVDPLTRVHFYQPMRIRQLVAEGIKDFLLGIRKKPRDEHLARIIRQWRPDIIHTLGLDPASYFYLDVRDRFGLQRIGEWVVQVRGGPDLALHRLVPTHLSKIRHVLRECTQLIADNQQNYIYARELGLDCERISSLGVVPGTGGINVEQLTRASKGLPSTRGRLILWPKAYECPQGKALPVFEAIVLAWDRLQPCEIHMLAMIPETRMWYQTLPEEIRRNCHVYDRMPRPAVLSLMAQSRIMLAPSLADGIPNTLCEAMAAGAFPIVSPLDTIQPIVKNERNVLFARNLYPQEIAEALCRAMHDDELVDHAAERNLKLVRKIADRSKIRPRVIEYYGRLAREGNQE